MSVEEFLAQVQDHPDLEVIHRDQTICIVRHRAPEGERTLRLGLWAVERAPWERLALVLKIPLPAAT